MMHYGTWLDGAAATTDDNRYYNGYGELSSVYANGHHHRHQPQRQQQQQQQQQQQHQQQHQRQHRSAQQEERSGEEESERTGDETQETATSCERSSSADIFRLEFAASQWSRLVSNAEGLFNKLMRNNLLPNNEQDQIEQWLCLKQEYEECIGSGDESVPGCQEAGRRSLERIEEVTETDESGNPGKIASAESSDASDDDEEEEEVAEGEEEEEEEEEEDEEEEDEDEEEEEEEDASSENPDFLEKLDDFMRKFKEETDRMIESNKYEFQASTHLPTITRIIQSNENNNNNNNDDYVPIVKPIPIRNPNSRRNSILPGSEQCNEVINFNGNFQRVTRACRETSAEANETGKEPDVLVDALRSLEIPEPVKALKSLTANNVAKQSLVRKIQDDLEIAQRRIVELQSTIRAKERFIEDMNRNSNVRMSAKEKFQLRRNRLEEEYYNTRSQLAQAENASLRDCSGERSEEDRREIERYRTMAINYEKRLVDIEMIKRIAGDSARKVLELESSLNSSRKQMEKLKRQLRREEERKRQLERELADDQARIRELEDKYNLTASKLREMRESQEEHQDPRQPEDNHRRHHHHHHHRVVDDHEKKNLLEVSARISHLDQVLKEKSMNLERVTDTDEKEALRHEIRNLRRTRECLIEEKCGLDEKLQKERTLSIFEERKLLECGETIEAIDAMIEHKNEMICGRADDEAKRTQREKSERMLSQLEKLSDGEMRTLFDKYFWKVIDLKQSSKNLEIQAAELERHVELQDKRVRALTEALQRTKLEAERRVVELQREQHERIHLMFRHIAEETGASSSHEVVDRNLELARFKRENKTLRRRLADVEALLKPNATGAPPAARKNLIGPPRIVQQELKKIAPKTKVTRERNKLIIQQTIDSDKRKK